MFGKTPPAPPDLTGHGCAAAQCRRFGAFGFGPPKPTPGGPPVRWYCAEHQSEGRAWWTAIQAAGGPAGVAVDLPQGRLL